MEKPRKEEGKEKHDDEKQGVDPSRGYDRVNNILTGCFLWNYPNISNQFHIGEKMIVFRQKISINFAISTQI